MKMLVGGGRGAEIFQCLGSEGFWKVSEVKGKGLKSGNKTKNLITWAGIARFEISAP